MDFPDHWALVSIRPWDPTPRPYTDPETGKVTLRYYCTCGQAHCCGVHPAFKRLDMKPGERRVRSDYPNKAVLTGSHSGIVVVDCDDKHDGADGIAAFREIIGSNVDAIKTYVVKTPSGKGLHFYYSISPEQYGIKNSVGKLGPGIDVRAETGIVVAEGSKKPHGEYRRVFGDPRYLAPLPKVLWDRMISAGLYQDPITGATHEPLITLETPSTPETRKQLVMILRRLRDSPPGKRNDALYRVGVSLGNMIAACECTTLEARDSAIEIIKHWPDLNKSIDTLDRAMSRGRNIEVPVIVIKKGVDKEPDNNKAIEALARKSDVFVFNGLLARAVPAQPLAPIQAFNVHSLRERLTKVVKWVKTNKEGDRIGATPDDNTVNEILSRGGWPDVREVAAYSPCPVVRPDLTWVNCPGWDHVTNVYQTLEVDLPKRVSKDVALATLKRLVKGFKFKREEDMAAWFAAALTPILYFAIGAPCPLFLFDAPMSGAGKSYLASAAGVIFQGSKPAAETYSNDEEFGKKLVAHGMQGTRLVAIDNIKSQIGGQTIEALVTASEYSGRILGVSKMWKGKLQACWYLTGNNVQTTLDMTRRLCHIRLEPRSARPANSGEVYEIADFEAHVAHEREMYLGAFLSLIDAYREAEMPLPKSKAPGGFSQWHRFVIGIVEWLGFAAPNNKLLEARSTQELGDSALLTAIAQFGAEGISVLDLHKPSPDPRIEALRVALDCNQRFYRSRMHILIGRGLDCPNGRSARVVLTGDRFYVLDYDTDLPVVGPEPKLEIVS